MKAPSSSPVATLTSNQGTRQFPKENEYSEVWSTFVTSIYHSLLPSVSFQEQWWFKCIHFVVEHQLSLSRLSLRSPRSAREILRIFSYSTIRTVMHHSRTQRCGLRTQEESPSRSLEDISTQQDPLRGGPPLEQIWNRKSRHFDCSWERSESEWQTQ